MVLKNKHLATIFIFNIFMFVVVFSVKSQTLLRLTPQVTMGNMALPNAWAGGLSCPQPSSCDLNNDGVEDLVIFDRVGNVFLTFINNNIPGVVSYTYDPSYLKNFPALTDFVLLRDYNGDGAMDIFAFSDVPGVAGIRVFKGYFENNELHFQRIHFPAFPYDLLYSSLPNGSFSQIYVAFDDYPVIDDIDGDGDLDVLTFASGGGVEQLYNNKSIELGFGKDTLIYQFKDECWGKFFESGITTPVNLGNIDSCAQLFQGEGISTRHAGSTGITFDLDNDGDKELVLGDISFFNFNLLINGGTNQNAFINDQVNDFPSVYPVDILYPAPFYLDLNNDGKKDLLAAPNTTNNNQNYDVAWYYPNIQSNEHPDFSFSQKDLLVNEMIDLGSGSSPAFADVNGDGLIDMVIGNNTYFEEDGSKNARLVLYINQGTAESPSYVLQDDNWLGFFDFSSTTWDFAPTFGDIDNDGDLDLIVGDEYGKLFFLKNIAGQGQPMQFASPVYGYENIDVGQVAKPNIVDLDRDGLPDLVIGERNGNLNFYKNIGTATIPDFNVSPTEPAVPITELLGGVDTREPGMVTGFSDPVFLDFNHQYYLFTGTEHGHIRIYDNIDGNITGTFNLLETDYGMIREGDRTSIALADINKDSILEMIVGNFRGGVSLFQTSFKVDGSADTYEIDQKPHFTVYPNPANNVLMIDIEHVLAGKSTYRLLNLLGQEVKKGIILGDKHQMDLNGIPSGVYMIEVGIDRGRSIQKVIINH